MIFIHALKKTWMTSWICVWLPAYPDKVEMCNVHLSLGLCQHNENKTSKNGQKCQHCPKLTEISFNWKNI